MGRHKGSKNKPKTEATDPIMEQSDANLPVKRGRGRPAGSKNKTTEYNLVITKEQEKNLIPLFGNEKEIKREIRRLRKVKLQCRAGSEERIELHRKIKDLKKSLKEIKDKKLQEEVTEQIDDNKYKKIYFSGWLSKNKIEIFKRDYGIWFIKKEI